MTSHRVRRWRSWLRELLIFLVIFVAMMWFLERNLLPRATPAPLVSEPLPTLSGGTRHLLADDKKRTLVFFFAPWCHVCAADMPNLRKVARAEEDVAVRLVALSWEDASEVRAFVSEHDWPGEVLLGNERLREAYQVSGFPTYYVLNQKGEILSASRGYATYAGLWLRLHW